MADDDTPNGKKKKPNRKRRGRGEGGVHRRADGLYEAVLSLGTDAHGKREKKTVYGKTKAEALAKLRALQAQHDAGRLVRDETLTAAEYLRRWLATAKDRVRATTYDRHRQIVELHLIPALGSVRLAKLSPLNMEQVYTTMAAGAGGRKPASAWTRRAAAAVLSTALRAAVRLKLIPSNPAADASKPKPPEREPTFLTAPQVGVLLAAVKAHPTHAGFHPLFAVAVGSGLRQGELFGLHWNDIDLTTCTVHVRRALAQVNGVMSFKEPKSKTSRRSVVLPAFAAAALTDHRAAAEAAGLTAAPVFCTSAGTPIPKSNFGRRVFRKLIDGVNAATPGALPAAVRFHDLRHTHASLLISAGQSIKAVSRRMGHSDVTVTLKVYAHVLPDDDARLAAGLDGLIGAGSP